MSNLETALRAALAKGDIEDPAFRRRVYTAAANAMERTLGDKAGASQDKLVEQRKRLATVITGIENEVRKPAKVAPAAPPPVEMEAPPVAPQPKSEEQSVVSQTREKLKLLQRPPKDGGRREPVLESLAAEGPASTHGADAAQPVVEAPGLRAEPRVGETSAAAPVRKPARRRFHPFATGLAVIVLLAFLVAGGWWVVATGAFQSAEERDTSVPNPAPSLSEESFSSRDPGTANAPTLAATEEATEEAEAEGWLNLFTPDMPTALDLKAGATAEIRNDPFGNYARLVTPLPNGEARIEVPAGILLEIEGSPVQISLMARSDDGAATQMSVRCDFGPIGDCGRRRFNVDQAPAEFLFRIDLPTAGEITKSGYLILQTDIENGSKPVNLLSARIRKVANP